MKFVQKMLVALACLGFSSQALAYVWTFTNLTEKPIVIQFRLSAWGYNYYDIVNPADNSTRFSWPLGTLKAGFCIDKFFVGQLEPQHLQQLFGKTTFPTAAEIAKVCGEDKTRAILDRIGKREPSIKWISGERWGTFDKATTDAVNTLSKGVTDVAGEAANLIAAAGAETATGGSTAGAAGAAAKKLDLGKIFTSLSSIPGAIMTLAQKSPCASRHFDVIKNPETGAILTVTKD